MIPKKWHIRLDMQKQYDNEIIEMIRQDTYSNELIIHLVQNGSVVDFTDTVLVAIVFDKSDGTQVIGSCEILQNGLVRYIVDYQALTSLGITTITLKLVDSDMIETSTSFNINVIADPFFGTDGSVMSTSEYPILTNLLNNLSNVDVNLDIIQEWIDNPEQFKGDKGEKGEQGERGIQGKEGSSAYHVWLSQGNIGTINDYLLSLKGDKGDKGDKGEKGDTGEGLNILGSLSSSTELPLTGNIGDGYLITGNLWVWNGTGFEDVGNIRGPQGEQGEQGPQGEQGEQGPKGDKGTDSVVVNTLTETIPGKALDATQGKKVNDDLVIFKEDYTMFKTDTQIDIIDIKNSLGGLQGNDMTARLEIMDIKLKLDEMEVVDYLNKTGIGFFDLFKDNTNVDIGNTTATVNIIDTDVIFEGSNILKMNDELFDNFSNIELTIYDKEREILQVDTTISNDNKIQLTIIPGTVNVGDRFYYKEQVVTVISTQEV